MCKYFVFDDFMIIIDTDDYWKGADLNREKLGLEIKGITIVSDEKNIVTAGDTMLKKDGIEHGCVCLEEGVLLDIFSPMREDFVE